MNINVTANVRIKAAAIKKKSVTTQFLNISWGLFSTPVSSLAS